MTAPQKSLAIVFQAAAAMAILVLLPYEGAARVFTFRASVPFQFVIGQETLPAATYTVEVLIGRSQSLDKVGIVVLKTPDGRVYRTAFTTVADVRRLSPPRSSLIFKRLDGRNHLTLVIMASAELNLGVGSQLSSDATPTYLPEVPMEILH